MPTDKEVADARKQILEHEGKESIVEALESLSDFIKDSENCPSHRDLRIFMSPAMYAALSEEVGHDVDIVRGIRLSVLDPKDLKPTEGTAA